jgi:DNA-binding NarL/FixJ family response regulator
MSEPGTPIPVLVVEDDAITRQALIDKVEHDPALCVCGAAGTVAEALPLIEADVARVALMDLGLPDGDGTDLIRLATAREPPLEVMVITVFGDERHVVRAIEAGATAYLLKDADASTVAESIHALLAGGSPISTSIARHLLKRFRREPVATTDAAVQLTPREVEVLEVVSRGFSNAEIGELLHLSLHTVNSHIKNIYRKLAVRSRSEAVFEAVQQGLIHLDKGP